MLCVKNHLIIHTPNREYHFIKAVREKFKIGDLVIIERVKSHEHYIINISNVIVEENKGRIFKIEYFFNSKIVELRNIKDNSPKSIHIDFLKHIGNKSSNHPLTTIFS